MSGIYVQGKILYTLPGVNYLSGGTWKTGFSKIVKSPSVKFYYDIFPTDKVLVEGQRYKFELKDGIAHVKDI